MSIERPRERPCDVRTETNAVFDAAWTKTIHIEHDIAPIHQPSAPNIVPSPHAAAAVHEDDDRECTRSIGPIEITRDRRPRLSFELDTLLFRLFDLERGRRIDGTFEEDGLAERPGDSERDVERHDCAETHRGQCDPEPKFPNHRRVMIA